MAQFPWQVVQSPDPMSLMQLSQGIGRPYENLRRLKSEEEMTKYREQQALFRQMLGMGGAVALQHMRGQQRKEEKKAGEKPEKPRVGLDVAEDYYAETGDPWTPTAEYTAEHRYKKALGNARKEGLAEYKRLVTALRGDDDTKRVEAKGMIEKLYPDALKPAKHIPGTAWATEETALPQFEKEREVNFPKLRQAVIQGYEGEIKTERTKKQLAKKAGKPKATEKAKEPKKQAEPSTYQGKEYQVGDIIETPTGKVKVIGFYPDGEPNVERIR